MTIILMLGVLSVSPNRKTPRSSAIPESAQCHDYQEEEDVHITVGQV